MSCSTETRLVIPDKYLQSSRIVEQIYSRYQGDLLKQGLNLEKEGFINQAIESMAEGLLLNIHISPYIIAKQSKLFEKVLRRAQQLSIKRIKHIRQYEEVSLLNFYQNLSSKVTVLKTLPESHLEQVHIDDLIEKQSQLFPDDPLWNQLKAIHFIRERNWKAAVLSINKLLKQSNEKEWLFLLAKSQIEDLFGNQFSPISEYSFRSIESDESTLITNFNKRTRLFNLQFHQAIDNLDKALKLDPQNPWFLLHRIQWFTRRQQILFDLPFTADQNGNYFKVDTFTYTDFNCKPIKSKSLVIIKRKNDNQVLQDLILKGFQRLLEKKPLNILHYFMAAQIIESAIPIEKAHAIYNQILALDKEYTDAYRQRVKIFELVKNFPAAIKDYQTLIELEGNEYNSFGVNYNLGQAYLKTHQYVKAIQVFNQLVASDRKNTIFLLGRAEAYEKLNQIDLAIQDFTTAIEISPIHLEFYRNRIRLAKMINHQALIDKDTGHLCSVGQCPFENGVNPLFPPIPQPCLPAV